MQPDNPWHHNDQKFVLHDDPVTNTCALCLLLCPAAVVPRGGAAVPTLPANFPGTPTGVQRKNNNMFSGTHGSSSLQPTSASDRLKMLSLSDGSGKRAGQSDPGEVAGTQAHPAATHTSSIGILRYSLGAHVTCLRVACKQAPTAPVLSCNPQCEAASGLSCQPPIVRHAVAIGPLF